VSLPWRQLDFGNDSGQVQRRLEEVLRNPSYDGPLFRFTHRSECSPDGGSCTRAIGRGLLSRPPVRDVLRWFVLAQGVEDVLELLVDPRGGVDGEELRSRQVCRVVHHSRDVDVKRDGVFSAGRVLRLARFV
jgi:hypothetical protein